VGEEIYGLNTSWVRGVQRAELLLSGAELDGGAAPDPPPDGWLSGDDGEQPLPVYGLGRLLGLPTQAQSGSQRVVVIDDGAHPWAMLVDRVSRVVPLPAEQILSLPSILVTPSANYFQGVIRREENLNLLLAPERLHPAAGTDGPRDGGSTEPVFSIHHPMPSPVVGEGSERSDQGEGRIVVFSVSAASPDEGDISLALSVSQVPEVLDLPPVTPVPGAPPFALGLINWRGRSVPIIDLAQRLGLASGIAVNEHSRLMVTRSAIGTEQARLLAFPIHPTVRVLRLPLPSHPSQQPLPVDPSLTHGAFTLKNETLIVPALKAVSS
jgi:chemotaxis signal transduction protein